MESTTEVQKLKVSTLEGLLSDPYKTSWSNVVGNYVYVIPLTFSAEYGMCYCPEKIGSYDIDSSYSNIAFDYASFVSDTFNAGISQHVVCIIKNLSL